MTDFPSWQSKSAEQLAIVAGAWAAIAERLATPWWYHPILGLLTAVHLVAISLGSTLVRVVAIVLFAVALGILADAYRRLSGVWISGLTAGSASRWAKALGVLSVAAMTTSSSIAYWTELTWPVWCLAAVVLVSTVVLGRRFDTALRTQLRADA
jgi:hypothetical protein